MEKAMVVLMIATSMLVGCSVAYSNNESYDEQKKVKESDEIYVGGKVLCQDCTQGWNQWIHGANPIKGSVVAITCMDERNHVVRYARDETDINGQFDFSVPMTCESTGKRIDPKRCTARLVSSPDPSCNVLTNFGSGLLGVALGLPSSVYHDIDRYTLGPFYFTSPMCEKPELDEEHADAGNGY